MKQKFHYQKIEHDKNTSHQLCFCCCCSIMAFGQNMTQEIERLSKGSKVCRVAIIHNDDIIAIANEDKYPLMSVFKFHIVTALKEKWKQRIFRWTKWVYIKQKEMLKNTYSR